MKGDQRYTSSTVFDSFPWPQAPGAAQIGAVAGAAVALRALRRDLAARRGLGLRALYAAMERPGHHPLGDAHAALDAAVRAAYGMPPRGDPLAFLLDLNGPAPRGRPRASPSRAPASPRAPTPRASSHRTRCSLPTSEPPALSGNVSRQPSRRVGTGARRMRPTQGRIRPTRGGPSW